MVTAQLQGHRQAVFDRREVVQAVDRDASAAGPGRILARYLLDELVLAEAQLFGWAGPVIAVEQSTPDVVDSQLPARGQAIKRLSQPDPQSPLNGDVAVDFQNSREAFSWSIE